jgi:alkane 1-monooxygenase
MSGLRALKYSLSYIPSLGSLVGIYMGGYYTLFPLVFAFILVPLVELMVKPDPVNLSLAEAELVAKDPLYDWLIWLLVPFQWITLILFLHRIKADGVTGWEAAGMTACMGMMCGIIGINVGHELGHRSNPAEQLLAKIVLLSSLYMHFFIEHNRGHHKRVGTPDDPASARFNESLYAFWFRSVIFSYRSAWELENHRLKKSGQPILSLKNQMLQFHLIQAGLLLVIWSTLGMRSLLFFLMASLIGILLLEAVNYIEHYGLARHQRHDGSYGRTLHCHSWNSDHILGRVLLFELSRHSDHHYKASKKYPLLEHIDESPQMPAGYPGMIILALIPPLFFKVINPLLKQEMKRMPDIALAG